MGVQQGLCGGGREERKNGIRRGTRGKLWLGGKISFYLKLLITISYSETSSNFIFILGKSTHNPSNYHSIVNVLHKLPIVSISPLKLPENVNVPPKTNKKTKMTLIFF
jgi:hypothetical protein